MIRGYTNTDSPITSDFTGVYHDVIRLDLNCIRDNTTKGFDTTTNGVTEVRNVVLPLH